MKRAENTIKDTESEIRNRGEDKANWNGEHIPLRSLKDTLFLFPPFHAVSGPIRTEALKEKETNKHKPQVRKTGNQPSPKHWQHSRVRVE